MIEYKIYKCNHKYSVTKREPKEKIFNGISVKVIDYTLTCSKCGKILN